MHKINKDLGIDPLSSSSESQPSDTSSFHSESNSIITEEDIEDSSLSAHSKSYAKNISNKKYDGKSLAHQKTSSKDKDGDP
jgi:hypothetical protein